jgi:hypothetical protein
MSFRQQRQSHPGIIIHDLFGSGYAGLGSGVRIGKRCCAGGGSSGLFGANQSIHDDYRTSSSFLIFHFQFSILHFKFPGDSFGVGRVTNESLGILTISRLTGASQTVRRRQSMKWDSADGIQSI